MQREYITLEDYVQIKFGQNFLIFSADNNDFPFKGYLRKDYPGKSTEEIISVIGNALQKRIVDFYTGEILFRLEGE
jgi:hypothetical protein